MGTIAGTKVGQGRRLYVSATRQTEQGTEATLTHIIDHMLDSEPLEIDQERMDDDLHASGNDSDHPRSHLVLGHSLNQPFSCLASLELIGIFLSAAMNAADTKTGGAAPYAHDLAYAALPNFLPMLTLEEHMGGATWVAATDRRHLDVSIDSFELAVPGAGQARINLGLLGTGRTEAGSDITEGGLRAFTGPMPAPKFRVSIEANSSNGASNWDGTSEVSATAGAFPTLDSGATDISSYMSNLVIRVLNGSKQEPEFGSSVGSGLYNGQVMPAEGGRRVEVEFTAKYGTPFSVLLHSLADSTNLLQKEWTIILNATSDTAGHGGMIALPVCALMAKPSGMTGRGPLSVTYKFRARKCALYQPIVAKICNFDSMAYA